MDALGKILGTSAPSAKPAAPRSSPITAGGKAYSGRSCDPRGGPNTCVITAHDAATGAELWRRRLIPGPGEPGNETWGAVPFEERGHVGSWMAPSYDPELNPVYVGTSVTSPTPKFMLGGTDLTHLYHNSTLALHGDTGEIVWYCQHLNDHWDLDHPFERLLVDTAVRPDPSAVAWTNPRIRPGEERRVLTGIPGKTGIVYTLDRETGEFLWATPTITQNVVSGIDGVTGAVTSNPELVFTAVGQQVLACPHASEGKDWGAGAYFTPDQHHVHAVAQRQRPDDGRGPEHPEEPALRHRVALRAGAGLRGRGKRAGDLGRDRSGGVEPPAAGCDDGARRDRRRGWCSAATLRHWVQRLTVEGRRRDQGPGGYPYVGLAEARPAGFANRQVARRAGDPTAAVRPSRSPTFRKACEHVAKAATWKGLGAKNRENALERYCGPLMARRLDQIRRADVIAILAPVMAQKPAIGSKLHGWIRSALAWGVARERLEFNVADRIGAALPARRAKKHHASLPYRDVGAALETLSTCGASEVVKACLRFARVRRGAPSGAEMDLQAAEWRIPAERMKGSREYRVPLSPASVETLEAVSELHSPAACCVLSPTRAGKAIAATSMAKALKVIYGDRCTVHGFRSSFRDWASEQTNAPHAVAEAVLAHQVGSTVERSYARSDLFEKRRDLMDRWAEFAT